MCRRRLPWPGGSRSPPKASRGLGSSFGVNFVTRPTRQAARTYASSDDGEVCASGGCPVKDPADRVAASIGRRSIRPPDRAVRAHRLPRLWRLLQQVAAFLHLRWVESQCLNRRCFEKEATSLLVSYKRQISSPDLPSIVASRADYGPRFLTIDDLG